MVSAGTLYEFQRETIKNVFKGKIFNKYGSRDAGDMACECDKGKLHQNIFTHYIEILDKNLKEVKENEVGDIYVTVLNNYSMPFIRYRIGDSAKYTSETCTCGRGLPLIKNVIGRSIDSLENVNGKFIPAEFFIHFIGVVFNDGIIDRFQVIQDRIDSIIIRLEIRDMIKFNKNKRKIEKVIEKVFENRVKITWKFENKIEDEKSGKFRYVISELNK